MITSQLCADSERYWHTLLSDFDSVPLTERVRAPSASASICITKSSSDLEHPPLERMKHDDIRLTLLYAWSVVLSQHAGTNDVLVAEVLPRIPFVPRRVQFASTSPAREQLSTQLAQDTIHASVAWEVSRSVIEIDEAIHSVVEILEEPGFSLCSLPQRSHFRSYDTPLDLTLSYTPSRPFTFTLRFDPSAFDAQDVQYMLDHLVLAFEQLLVNPSLSGAEVNMMTANERAFVQELPSVVKINCLAEPENPARYSYVYDLLARRALTHPDNVAVECDGKVVYTYSGLDAASNQCAQYLKDVLSVRPGDIVLLFLTQSPTAIVLLYAILKVGAAYLAVDIDMPAILFHQTVDMTNCSLFLTVTSLEEKLRTMSRKQTIVSIDTMTEKWCHLDSTWQPDLFPIGNPKNTLAYLGFTSGSTGPPKKCMTSHSNLVHWIVEAAPAFGRTMETRQLMVYELYWDGSIEEIFLTHYVGGTVCIAMIPEIIFHIHEALVATKANSITLTPTQGMQLHPADYPFLKSVVFTGETLTKFVREKWLGEGRTLLNAFGPSESICALTVETPVRSSASNNTPVGFSIGGQTRLYVLGSDMKFEPVGCVGEIFVSGPTVGLGYLGDPEATARSFLMDPFRREFRMYRTGDFGRVNHEGRLYLTGRRDSQVQLHAYRIELGEIEAALHAAESKWSIAVEVVTYNEEPRIASFLAPRFVSGAHSLKLQIADDVKAEILRLMSFSQPRLLKFCYPELWIPLDALPCTLTGKLNRKYLRDFFHGLLPSTQNELAMLSTAPKHDACSAAQVACRLGTGISESLT
ncbi:hypothetical protein M404DRAFT_1007001 [Pisolithus tinctorius Marx 270]|uniref:AMP-dependent synthetase/ligase domain-containing protein n=1 Tax=Pisolithus tinctorius Marx 270 TaxID=870435 RepID=A0A0C3JEX0_PISTI|nr:hypothetical protein M404DRAFT_1007001 [Pisolithus tinctorius Marx 270]